MPGLVAITVTPDDDDDGDSYSKESVFIQRIHHDVDFFQRMMMIINTDSLNGFFESF